MTGHCWMNKSLEDAKNDGSVKTTEEIRLSNDEKKVVRKGVSFDEFDETEESFAMVVAARINPEKVKLREEVASYIYSPMNRKFATVVRVTAIVLKFVGILKVRRQGSMSRTGPRTNLRMFTVSSDQGHDVVKSSAPEATHYGRVG